MPLRTADPRMFLTNTDTADPQLTVGGLSHCHLSGVFVRKVTGVPGVRKYFI
jgi:hypothetical protein